MYSLSASLLDLFDFIILQVKGWDLICSTVHHETCLISSRDLECKI